MVRGAGRLAAQPNRPTAGGAAHLVPAGLELVRHTPTYSPPVASRAFAYLGVTAFEAVATGSDELQSLAGQLNGLQAAPHARAGTDLRRSGRDPGRDGAAVQESLRQHRPDRPARHGRDGAEDARRGLGRVAGRRRRPQRSVWQGGRRAHAGMVARRRRRGRREHGLPAGIRADARAGALGADQPDRAAADPLLPDWGKNRTFAMPNGATCALPAPPEYSEDKSSEFYKEALEVYETGKNMTPEQRAIARFWSDDAMLSPTPPGHWISIALQILERDRTPTRQERRRAGASRRRAWPMASSAAGKPSTSTTWCGRSPISAASSIRNGSRCSTRRRFPNIRAATARSRARRRRC